MRLHLKQQPPDVHGMISEHKASHGHKSKEDTVTCLIREAMRRYDETDKIADLSKLINRYIDENNTLKFKTNLQKERIETLEYKLNMMDADGSP
ncbi:MAG: hypothetical protein WC623_22085 [Pedobacter sp.]|uniref:hypothetical protein n=1 Tax=Pedobacter sp. TaxID=1411316 RepID=UPI003569896D